MKILCLTNTSHVGRVLGLQYDNCDAVIERLESYAASAEVSEVAMSNISSAIAFFREMEEDTQR